MHLQILLPLDTIQKSLFLPPQEVKVPKAVGDAEKKVFLGEFHRSDHGAINHRDNQHSPL